MSLSNRPLASDLEALESITEASLSGLELDELLRQLIQRMVGLSGARAGEILLLEADQLVTRAAQGLANEQRLPRDAGFAWQVVEQGRPVCLQAEPGRPLQGPHELPGGAGALLGVPLMVRGQAVGVAYVELAEARPFSEREVRRFEVLADRAALAIEHARLFQESCERTAALEAANARLAAANAELRKVDRLKTDFLAMVSHELRTPLTAIIGYTDLLLRGTHGTLSERQLRDEEAVKQGAQRLLALINDLLDVSRLDSGLIEVEPTAVSLANVFDLAVAQTRGQGAAGELSLRVELPASPPRVWGDPARLVQVVANLLSNAVKFTPAGGRVDLWAERVGDGERVRVCVRDTGAGIAPEHLAHIWDRFYQADSSVRRRYGGTGLGLAIVRGLVELHGGTIQAESPGLGRGATFCFELPTYQDPAAPRPEAPEPPGEAQPAADQRSILVVEDEPDNRELIATVLAEVLGLQVLAAADGLDAIEQAASRPSLIILDLMLPRLNGFEVARRLKASSLTRDIPILALTALARASEREEALAAGCDALLLKPFETDDLIAAVAEQLRISDQR